MLTLGRGRVHPTIFSHSLVLAYGQNLPSVSLISTVLKGLYWAKGLTGKSISWALEEILVWFNKQIITTEGSPMCVRESASGWKHTEWLGVYSISLGSSGRGVEGRDFCQQ